MNNNSCQAFLKSLFAENISCTNLYVKDCKRWTEKSPNSQKRWWLLWFLPACTTTDSVDLNHFDHPTMLLDKDEDDDGGVTLTVHARFPQQQTSFWFQVCLCVRVSVWSSR